MWNLGNFAFAAPWTLLALLILPVIWHLLKITPPKPTIIRFPAIRILHELSTTHMVTAKTPWWVLLIRLLIILFLIFAMAQPLWNVTKNSLPTDKTLIIVIDNDWSVMDRWGMRQTELNTLLERAARNQQPVLIVPTATPQKQWPLRIETAQEAKNRSATLRPNPWPSDRLAALTALKEKWSEFSQTPTLIWLSNGILETKDDDFLNQLHLLGDLSLMRDAVERLPIVITSVNRNEKGLQVNVIRASSKTEKSIEIRLQDDQANVLFQKKIDLARDTPNTEALLDLPAELRSRSDRLRIGGSINVGAQFLLDEKWRDRPVGIIKSRNEDKKYLDPSYYIRKSLRPHALLREENLDILLSRELAVLLDMGASSFSNEQNNTLLKWVSQGGIFVRFASQNLAERNHQNDPLLPVDLLKGDRTLGGALSWKQATDLSLFPQHSPFFGLDVPREVSIKRQILARPETNLLHKTWASLTDGTPLITAKKQGKGWVVLFHITAAPDWSNLPLSGTFELMLKRLLSLSAGMDTNNQEQDLAPYLIFNGQGDLVSSNGMAGVIDIKLIKTLSPSAKSPPGLYGQENALHALNLGTSITEILPIVSIPLGVHEQGFNQVKETNLAPWSLLAALCLALIDWMIALSLRSFIKASAIFLPFLIMTSASAKQDIPNLEKALEAANHMRLAYMVTHDAETDQTSKLGLDGLSMMLRRRTAVELAKPMAFDPEIDDPSLFPLIYWPVLDRQKQISDATAEKLNLFLETGGFIIFDTQGQPRPQLLARLTQKLNIPRLQPVSSEHVLTKSFYLLQRFPGRYDHPNIWVEAHADNARDRVSSVLVGANSWTQAWARDESLRPLYPVIPGGEIQREQAFRFGINLVMYVLSGNYKGDQVHLPAIMQRLGL